MEVNPCHQNVFMLLMLSYWFLQVLWDRGQATTREVCDEVYPDGETSEYYTVQKLLQRLEQRGCVLRDRTNRVHVFFCRRRS